MKAVKRAEDEEVSLVVPHLISINGKQHGALADALMDAFNRETLHQMAMVKLNVNLDEIVGGSTYGAVVFNLVDWAKRSGYLTELLQGALDMPIRKVTKDGGIAANFPKRKLRAFALEVGAKEA